MTFDDYLEERVIIDRLKAAHAAIKSGLNAYKKERENQKASIANKEFLSTPWEKSIKDKILELKKANNPDKKSALDFFVWATKSIPSNIDPRISENLFRQICDLMSSKFGASCHFPNNLNHYPKDSFVDKRGKNSGNVQRVITPGLTSKGKWIAKTVVLTDDDVVDSDRVTANFRQAG